MNGMNRWTGKYLSGEAHLRQSISMILTTRLGSRVMLPEFGSEILDLVDLPLTESTELRIIGAVFDSISRWEPRLDLKTVEVTNRTSAGVVELTITGDYEGERLTLSGIRIGATDITDSIPVDVIPVTPTDPSIPIPPTPTSEFEVFIAGDEVFITDNEVFGRSK